MLSLRGGLILSAVGVYLLIMGCVLSTGSRSPGKADHDPLIVPTTTRVNASSDRLLSMVMQIQRPDLMSEYKQRVDEIAAVGATTVKFVVDARQENGSSSRIFIDMRMTPSAEALADLIRHAKGRGLKVILMPIVLLDKPIDREWRGRIEPKSWPDWWDSYRAMLSHFTWIAEGNGVDVLVIGSELLTTEPQTEQWNTTIAQVRKGFSGKITYSSNWDHYEEIKFWDKLDYVAMNSYWTLGKNNKVSVEEIVKNWRVIQRDLLPFVQKQGKPLMFLEVGWCSMSNAASEPWDYTTGDPVDLDLQKRLYEGFFQAWHDQPLLGGFSIWEWGLSEGGNTDRGYTPRGKPAQQVLVDWMAKLRT